MSKTPLQAGFSAVELLITIFVGAIFIFAGYQLYSVVTQGNQEASDFSIANSLAISYLRKSIHYKDSDYNYTCAQLATNYALSSDIMLEDYIGNGTLTITCPNTDLPNLRRASVTATYRGVTATHALYYIQ